MILKVETINKSFNDKSVIKDISFEIGKGEIASILGPSGAGKTTILRCIAGLEKCEGGSIEICGMKLCQKENNQSIYPAPQKLRSIRSNIGMVFQGFNLFPHLSVLDNIIEAPMNAFGVKRKDAIAKAIELLSMLGLKEKSSAYPFELSGGEKQRTAIARACALNPKIMCFDEPTSALDPKLTEDIATIIEGLAQQGMAILIITHDIAFAKRISKRILFVEAGRILKDVSRDEFFSDFSNEKTNRFLAC